jgi:conjugative relaxase-like TrwC/TraI family protein
LPFTVLSIGKLARGQAGYYLDQARRSVDRRTSLTSGVEDYYLGGPEAAGEWIGSLAIAFALTGTVEDDELRLALDARSPGTGELLPRRPLRVPGFDVTFSAPKSVSVLFGVGGHRIRAEVRHAHDRAVAAAFGYLERNAAGSRRGRGGHEAIRGRGLLAAAFRHRTSRAGDPQLHTHVLIANVTCGADGVWRSLDGRRLYAHAKTAGYLYEARLRAELTRSLGVAWTRPRNGIADIVGVPLAVLRAFSRRRAEIERELRRLNLDGAAAAQVAALNTRRRKDYDVTPEQLAPEWRARARRLGIDAATIEAQVVGQWRPPGLVGRSLDTLRSLLASPSGLTCERSVVTRRDAIQMWCDRLPPGLDMTVERIEREVDALLRSDAFLPVLAPRPAATATIRRRDGRTVTAIPDERQYTTPDLVAAEQRIIRSATEGEAPVAAPTAVTRAIADRPALADEQADMVRRLTRDPARISVVVGKAGAGKTYALEAARAAWESSGLTVMGAAVARRAARELEEGSGIVSTSIAALLADLERAPALTLPPRTVVVIDEASLLPTRQLDTLVTHVVRADAKLVLVGDHRQLPAIQAGGAFEGLARRLGAIELTENRRQEAEWERAALDLLRDGQAPEALAMYRDHDRLVIGDDAASIRAALVSDWWQGGEVGDALMIAFRRADVRELNARARELMSRANRLGPETLDLPYGAFAAGDRVVLRRNDRRRSVANGDRGTVVRVDPAGERLEVAIGQRHVTLDASYLAVRGGRSALTHGYAVTGHVAQGMTVDRALVLGTDTLFQEWGYVAMSRGRTVNRFYAVASAPERDEFAPAEGRHDPIADITAALERSQAKLMATDLGRIAFEHGDALEREVATLRADGAASTEATIRELRRTRLALQEDATGGPIERMLEQDRHAALAETARRLETGLGEPELTTMARVSVLQRELRRREHRATTARRLIVSPDMFEAIGPRPERPLELARWCRNATTFELADRAEVGTRRHLSSGRVSREPAPPGRTG